MAYNQQAEITYVCHCDSQPHVDFVTGYVYYTWWGLWKYAISDYDYGHISNSQRIDQSTTVVEDDYSQRIYLFTDYKLHGGATSASFELDYQTTDAGNPPVAIVYQNDISITDATSS